MSMAVDAAAWEAMPADERAAISTAIAGLVANKLGSNPSGGNDEPTVHVIAAKRGPARTLIHFLIDRYMYCFAQSGSDWAEHDIFVGWVVVEGTRIVHHELTHPLSSNLRESETEDYRPGDVRDQLRDTTLAKLRAPRTERVIRCPECGSTDAGEVGGVADLAKMKCQSCGHWRMQDNYEIYDDWEVPCELADAFADPPPFLPPLPKT